MDEKKLQVKNLTISFRTQNGKVQAVRDISFDLYKGETLAIVGESGSGKSVTSKAIMGISAVNAIIENGEILYDGKDLTKIDENRFVELRGNKIAMIFQDPMSSLNPIMKIGKQLTEAMLLKGKSSQKNSRKAFNSMLETLRVNIVEATTGGDAQKAAEITQKTKNFDKFEYAHLDLENAYNEAREAAEESIDDIDYLIFEAEKNAVDLKTLGQRVKLLMNTASKAVSRYVVHEKANELTELIKDVRQEVAVAEKGDTARLRELLGRISDILKEAVAMPMPNFFAMGYFVTFSGEQVPEMPVDELNVFLRKYLDENFMLDFIAYAKEGIKLSFFRSLEKKKQTVELIDKLYPVFEKHPLNREECEKAAKELSAMVTDSIDRLALKKDDLAYIFDKSVENEIKGYFSVIKKNIIAEKKHAKLQAKYDAAVAKGKTPEWAVPPSEAVNEEFAAENIRSVIKTIREDYVSALENANSFDFDEQTVAMIDFLKAQAAGVVNRVTPAKAKHKAIKLMEEVGIPEPQKRFNQYPFEFSGGMRQRIVIAIALAANPDILICDEPTTALDVTIQAQILELINKLKEERKLSVIFITHDLGVVANMADRIAVMYAGKIVEYGTAEDVFYSPAHPYTWALLASMPDLDTNEKLDAIPGTPPNMIFPPKGDAFADRNKYAMAIDFEMQPPMFKISDTHYAATWLLHPSAPKTNPPKTVTDRIERMKAKGGQQA